MTINFLLTVPGGPFPDKKCCYCDKRPPTIWYTVDYRPARALPRRQYAKFDGYKPYCEDCCQEIALGMLRDVAEMRYGKEKANASYRHLLNQLRTRDMNKAQLVIELMKEETEQLKTLLQDYFKRLVP